MNVFDYVESQVFAFGEKKTNAKIKFEFTWKGVEEDIEYMYPSCKGCTDVYYDNQKIVGVLDLSKLVYDGQKNSVTKHIHISMNDGESEFIADDKLRRKPNPKKNWIRLKLTGLAVT